VEGRRTQLKILRESIQSLSGDVGSFRKSQEANVKRLEAKVGSLRKDLAAHAHSKDLSNHMKSHNADTKRLEKQVATLRNDLAALKSHITKEAAKSRAREEAVLSRMLAKVRTTKPSKKPPAKQSIKKKR
jgi:chromosome segregation ATPase